jgi:hypothetical protein
MRLLPLVAAALLLGAARTLEASTELAFDMRSEMTAGSAVGDPLASLRLAPLLGWANPRPSGTAALRYTPSVVGERHGTGAWRVLHEGAFTWTPVTRVGLHPSLRAAGQYGEFRATDVTPNTDPPLESRPRVATLRSYRLGLETGLTGELSRRRSLSLGLALDRSGGLESDAALLPPLGRIESSVRLASLCSRVESVESTLNVWYGELALGGTGFLAEVSHGRTRHLTRALDLSADLGVAEAQRSESARSGELVSPSLTGGLALKYAARSAQPGAQAGLTLRARPEFDRLDGSVHNRLQVRSSFLAPLGTATLQSALQWAFDLGPNPVPGHILSLESRLDLRLGQMSAAQIGLRAYQQTGHSSFEAGQVFAGWTTGWKGR